MGPGVRRTPGRSFEGFPLKLGRLTLDLATPRVMGILNVTPDSFSDGGAHLDPAAAVARARAMVAEGADLIDVGGESTRPGAAEVSVQEELDRVVPVIRAIAGELAVPVSVDTSKPEVMREAVAAGAVLINDVMALRRPGALETAASLGCAVCLMHMQGEPRTMQLEPRYDDVTGEVLDFLGGRVAACGSAGIAPDRILIDPGFGFGKTLAHNVRLMRDLRRFTVLGPVLVGVSRKSMVGALLGGVPVGERVSGSLAAALFAVEQGAAVVRTHDVRPTADVLRVWRALRHGDFN
jgi:dihydropteroate synthase